MVVVALLIGLAVPSISNLQGSARLNDTSDRVIRLFRLARQHATTENRRIEIRFFKFADPDQPGSTVTFRGATLSAPDAEVPNGLSNVYRFPTGIVMSSDANFSSIVNLGSTGTENDFALEGIDSAEYVGVTVRANGSFDGPPSEKYFVTLWQERDAAGGIPPKDYITIQVDPVSGGIETFRP